MKKLLCATMMLVTTAMSYFYFNMPEAIATSGACSWHGGVNCDAGSDWDGSVICSDGWTDSTVNYYENCDSEEYNPTISYYDGAMPSYYKTTYETYSECDENASGGTWFSGMPASTCTCDYGYYVEGGICVNLDEYCEEQYDGSHFSGNLCNCDYGELMYDNDCVDIDSICNEEYPNTKAYYEDAYLTYGLPAWWTYSCQCMSGYEWNSDYSSCALEENPNEVINASDTSDDNSYSNTNESYDYDAWCDDRFSGEAYYDEASSLCYCGNGYVYDSDSEDCMIANSWCEKMYGTKSEYDDETSDCVCKNGYEWEYISSNGSWQCSESYVFTDVNHTTLNETDIRDTFSDIGALDPNIDSISYLYDKGIISGYEDGTFRPLDSINRAELLKILVEGQGISPDGSEYNNCFSDVGDEWYAPYVCYAKEQGWVDGYADGTFKPAQTVNKVEALKMLINSQGYDMYLASTVEESPFSDTDSTAWYTPYLQLANNLNLLEETGDTYEPNGEIDRGGICENLYRLLMIIESGSEKFTEN